MRFGACLFVPVSLAPLLACPHRFRLLLAAGAGDHGSINTERAEEGWKAGRDRALLLPVLSLSFEQCAAVAMAGNDWINSYLEAILDAGPGIDAAKASSLLLRERGSFSPTRYFVEEVITGFDETDLYKTWVRVMIFSPIFCFF